MSDPFNLQRFVDAQDAHGAYERALTELRAGRKTSHWMWFVFPQIAGLGSSPTSRTYAISGLDEARAYLVHPVLGPRIRECASVLLELETSDAVSVFGSLDAQKLRSSMTLFAAADHPPSDFDDVLAKYFGGQPDPITMQRLAGS